MCGSSPGYDTNFSLKNYHLYVHLIYKIFNINVYTNGYTYSHPNLNFLQYTIQILVPHVMWSAQAVRDLKIDHTQRHLSTLPGTQST